MQPKQNNCASVVRQLDQQTVKGKYQRNFISRNVVENIDF